MRISHEKYADEYDICHHLCKYQIGDTVTLLKKFKYKGKIYKVGTPFIIQAIKLNNDFSNLLYNGNLRIFKEELKNWNADISVFKFTLSDIDNKNEFECEGKYLDKIKRKKGSIYRTVSIEQQLF